MGKSTILKLGYGFLIAFHSNYGCIFSRINTQYMNVTDTARRHSIARQNDAVVHGGEAVGEALVL